MTPRRPWHLWLAGIVGSLWSAMSAISFIVTQMNVEAVMSGFPPEQRHYFTSFPLWADAGWALGVFGGLAGSLLLMAGSRLAVPVFAASLIGALVMTLGGLFLLDGMAVMRATGGLGLTWIPVIAAAALTLYSRTMRGRGVLR